MKRSNIFLRIMLFSLLIIIISYKSFFLLNSKLLAKSEDIDFIQGKAYIIDGDSIKIKNHEIRLKDIDAPEFFQNCKNSYNKEYSCGKKSKEFLINLVKNYQVKCNFHGKDIYDRFLANCYVNDKDIAIEMIKNGWAVIYQSPSSLYKYQEIAKRSKLGIWQGDFIYPRQWRKLNKI